MRSFSLEPVRRCAFPFLFASLLAACQSPPSRLYLLSSSPVPSPNAAADLAGYGLSGRQHGRSAGSSRLVAVAVALPAYLDNTNIVQRANDNALKPDYSAQWGESLSLDATRVLAEDLAAGLPSVDVIMMPSRSPQLPNYEVEVDLTRFESDLVGHTVARGRWTITNAAGHEVASARVWREEQASGTGYEAIAAAMSRNLAALSADIARTVEALSRRDDTASNRPAFPTRIR